MMNVLEKIEKNKYRISTICMVMYCMLVVSTKIVFGADDGSALAVSIATMVLEALIKVIFIATGLLALIFGVVELAMAIFGQNPDAKNKAIMGFSLGFVLIVLGIAFLKLVPNLVSFLIS